MDVSSQTKSFAGTETASVGPRPERALQECWQEHFLSDEEKHWSISSTPSKTNVSFVDKQETSLRPENHSSCQAQVEDTASERCINKLLSSSIKTCAPEKNRNILCTLISALFLDSKRRCKLRLLRDCVFEVAAWTQKVESRKPEVEALFQLFDKNVCMSGSCARSRVRKQKIFSPSQLSKYLPKKTRKSRSLKNLRQNQNDSKSWYRFQCTIRLSIFAFHFTHCNVAPEAMKTHTSATFPFLFSYEGPVNFIVVSAGSQQKRGMFIS